MYTIDELVNKRADYQSSCYIAIKELMGTVTEITFDPENIEECPYCIGDNFSGIVDGIITKVSIKDNDIFITFVDNKDYTSETTENIKYLIHCDLIDLYDRIKCNINV